MLAAAADLAARREALLGVVDSEPRLTDAHRRDARRFLEGFFEEIEDTDDFTLMLERRCR